MPSSFPFDESRRLTGCNPYFADTGAALETLGVLPEDAALECWRQNIALACDALGWPAGEVVVRKHATGASLAFTAPADQLYAATEVNEWAWGAALDLPFSLREKVPEGRMRALPINPHAPYDKNTLAFARQLRKTSTDSEQCLWSMLRNRRMHDQKFRRQFAVEPYVLDFYCQELKLAVEVDGGQHNIGEHVAHDSRRDAFMAKRGITTLRYWNNDVLQRTEDVLADIWQHVDFRLSERHAAIGTSAPSSALRAPSPEERREQPSAAPAEPFFTPGHAAPWDQESAMQTLRLLARAEANPELIALLQETTARNLPALPDDEFLTLGEGIGSQTWPIDALPAPADVHWNALHAIPVALVTGSNGKTTTARALAAICRAHRWRTAHSCTDGVFVDGTTLESGDFSGPSGARAALRVTDVEAAVLEAARGGILRRGLAVCHAQAAIVTNISPDHFGEYGIHTLDQLAQVKLTVARAIHGDGLLVLNADDALLSQHADAITCPIGWFSLDAKHPRLIVHQQAHGTTCAPRDGHLFLHRDGIEHDLGAVADMPLSFGGHAAYNVANLAAAALGASALGIAPHTIAETLRRFGEAPGDNPGRMQRWVLGGVRVVLDYAHNVDGLQVLMQSAEAARGDGRLALVLGHAGNREDDDYRALAAIAAHYRPDFIVLKDIDDYLRGREPGEIAAIMRGALLKQGVPESNIAIELDETQAALDTLSWARSGDLLVLPIHSITARDKLTGLLDGLQQRGWQPGSPVATDTL